MGFIEAPSLDPEQSVASPGICFFAVRADSRRFPYFAGLVLQFTFELKAHLGRFGSPEIIFNHSVSVAEGV